MKIFLTCSSCGKRITTLLDNKIVLPDFKEFIDKPLLSDGQYCIDQNGNFYISISDKYNLEYHKDHNRRTGCCGPSLNGLPNLVCICKSEIGREVSDCIDPHFIILNSSGILLKDDHEGLLERILHLPISEKEKLDLETLFYYNQEEHLRQKLAMYSI